MKQKRLLSMLVLLAAVVSGAMAADGIECSASDIGKVICTDGSIYAKVSDVPTGKTAAAMIAYIDTENNKGLALALSDEGSMTWSDAKTACEGKSAVAGGTWVLPSKEQWEAMGAKESNSTSAKALRDGFSSVGGTNMQSGAYWSSTENSTNVNKAYRYYFTTGYYWENNVNKTVSNYVRACLTFNILVAPPTYSITLAEGTEDADKWTISPNPAEAGSPVTVTYSGDKKVKSVKAVKKAAYLKWDADQQKLVETEIPAEVTMVENADQNVTWAAGTYVVEGNVTIKGGIILNGNVELIIKDGAILTANQIYDNGSSYYNLSIYGQANKSGQLVVNSSDHAISGIRKLEVHSCKVKATSTLNRGGGFYRISTFNVYGGSVHAENTAGEGYGINLYDVSPMNIFGGEVKAVGKGNGDKSYGIMCESSENSANVKVYGGKLWAECATNKALKNINLTTEAGFTGKIEYSSDKSTWSKIADADAKYVRIDPAANAYLKWDPDQKKLVTTEIPEEVTMVQNANQDVTWAAGTYVVDGEVTINGKIFLDGNVDLIIKDDATLTVNKYINGSGYSSDYNLSIYGQANKSGQLVVNYSNFDNDAIFKITKLEVHSCQVKATSSYNDCGGFSDIVTFNVYGGSVDAENTGSEGYGIYLKNNSGSMNIYGGDVKVVGTGNQYGFVGYNATVTVFGGKLWAKTAGHQALSDYTKLTKGDGFNGKIETSDDGESWDDWESTDTPETRYVRAGY